MEQIPDKTDISNIFKRLRNIPSNKICFDCGAKNPTWASVTYGVFICMDCSAVHRSLGVHLSFVRSTQLDTNWTWLQIRAMQIGGNSKAKEFFQHHNHTTTDAQQKYNGKVANLYREKLHNLAISAMRQHGTKPFIELNVNEPTQSPEKKEVDFFKELTAVEEETSNGNLAPLKPALDIVQNKQTGPEPSVELLSNSPSDAPKVSEIRNISLMNKTAKKGMGAKRGLGAQRIATDFKAIEREAENLAIMKEKAHQEAVKQKEIQAEEEEKKLASMRLAYQDLSLQQKKAENKIKELNPKKAEQMERLGMGFSRNPTSAFTHSATSDMKTIQQSNPQKTQSKFKDFHMDDDFEFLGYSLGPPKYGDSPFLSYSEEKETSKNNWDEKPANKPRKPLAMEREDNMQRKKTTIPSATSSGEAQKLFGNAKSISSSQMFGNERDLELERRSNLNKFESSTSISSSEYFGKPPTPESNVPNLHDIKDSVKGGVTKVAGRLSNIASGVISSIQDRYGY
ncbi:ARFGAP2 [Cordylochernes scorpioides]|uniref:ARFGAP2 n=1 Tax=Cordylochernes scorpioides TaxID=51811 RepID=A0ABY6K6V0_9ARAC|nr:ARFGAP2 [Cordylochernes scorpioides]